MIDTFRQLFSREPRKTLPAVARGKAGRSERPITRAGRVPSGERVYAIGDIHGRLDLFLALIEAIEADDAGRGPASTTIVLLGDLVDRGPESAGVIAAARELAGRHRVRILGGNHEEMFLASFDDIDILGQFLRFGGRETVKSYLADRTALRGLSVEETLAVMQRAVPPEDIAFLRGLEDHIIIGDYLFVHAGIRPGVSLEEQRIGDLRWIREPFLSHGGELGFVVVHGHTITGQAEFRQNRIGIDTGAFMSGRLTALGLEGSDRWLLQTEDGPEAVSTIAIAA